MGLTLVTGASGFVGRSLVQEMQQRRLPVIGLARTPTAGLKQIASYSPNTDWIPHLRGVTSIVHLAARVHIMRETEREPFAAFRRANVEATIHLARSAADAGVKRFVFLSSIKVNGENSKPGEPFRHDDPPQPQDDYARSKAEAELALLEVAETTGLEVVIIRPPLVYGPHVKGNFATLIKWVKAGFPSPFRGIDNRRSLVHVRNLNDLIIACLSHPAAANQVFLVSDGWDLSTDDLLRVLGTTLGKPAISLPLVPSLAIPLLLKTSVGSRLLGNLQVDISSTNERIGWSPDSSIGFADTVAGGGTTSP